MFVDASAVAAVLLLEPEREALRLKMAEADRVLVSPLTIWEASRAVARVLDQTVAAARADVRAYLASMDAVDVPLGPAEEAVAAEAVDRFGKGRHPAQLNVGDCFSYACARVHGVPLLSKGDDFALTDIERA